MEFGRINRTHQFLATVGAFGIVTVSLIVYQYGGREGVEVLSVIVTSLLTLALVVLYFQQYSILEKQTEMQHRDYRSALTKRGKVIADDDTVTIKIKNKGRGKITRLFLKSEITSETGELDILFGRSSMSNSETGETELPPNSDFEEYSAKVNYRIGSQNGEERAYPHRFVTQKLANQGIDHCEIRLTLEVRDESLFEGEFAQEIVLVNQELEIKGPETVTIPDEDGNMVKKKVINGTSIEDGLDSSYSTENDIVSKEVDELFESS